MKPKPHVFQAVLVPGRKTPYAAWTFLVIPSDVERALGGGPVPVRGTLAGTPFRGSASRGEGVLRMPVARDLREVAGVQCGDTVTVSLERDPEARRVELPDELRAVFAREKEVARLFTALPPAHQRAWATYVSEAKRPETRARRAAAAPAGIRARAFPR